MSRSAIAIALAALALGVARAQDQCAESQCDAQEEAALLQHAAAKSAKVSAHSFANTTEACYDPTPNCVGGAKSYTCTGPCADNVSQLTQKTCSQLVEDNVNTWSYTAQQAACDVGKTTSECSCMKDKCSAPCGNLDAPCEGEQAWCVGAMKSYQCTGSCADSQVQPTGNTCAQLVNQIVGSGTHTVQEATCTIGSSHTECSCMTAGCPASLSSQPAEGGSSDVAGNCYESGDFANNNCGNRKWGCYPSVACAAKSPGVTQCNPDGSGDACRFCYKNAGDAGLPGGVACPPNEDGKPQKPISP